MKIIFMYIFCEIEKNVKIMLFVKLKKLFFLTSNILNNHMFYSK